MELTLLAAGVPLAAFIGGLIGLAVGRSGKATMSATFYAQRELLKETVLEMRVQLGNEQARFGALLRTLTDERERADEARRELESRIQAPKPDEFVNLQASLRALDEAAPTEPANTIPEASPRYPGWRAVGYDDGTRTVRIAQGDLGDADEDEVPLEDWLPSTGAPVIVTEDRRR